MIVQSLLGEFLHEAENTRKLLLAIPDSALDWKPSEKNWTTGQLASHVAEVYNWYAPTFQMNVFDMATYKYDKGNITKAANIVAKFEEHKNEFNFTIPIEIITPTDEDGALDEFYDNISEICSARSNNVQLRETAKGNQ